MKRFYAVAFLCISSFLAVAQNRPLTLNEAIATSLQNNYDIQLLRNDSSLAALDYAYANYALYPRLSATGGYIFNQGNRKEVRGNGDKGEGKTKNNNLSAALNLDWTLFDGFRMFIARDRLNSLIELGELQIKSQVITTVAEVMRLYYDVIRQQQLLRSLEEQMELSQERLRLAQYKFDIGTGAKPDLLQAQIDLNGQRSAYITQQVAINNVKQQLNNLLALPVTNEFDITDSTITFNPNLTLDSIQGMVGITNPELLLARKNLAIAGLDLRLIRAERFPVVEFNSTYNFNRIINNAIVNPVQQNQLLQTRGLSYGFTANIPIFNSYNNRRLIKAAEITIQSQQILYDRSLALINTNINTAYRDYDLYKRALVLEEENIILVRENIFIARERYRLGISTFIELREAQQSLADASNRLIQARYNTKIAEIELLRLRGDLVR
ncbi:MAG: TolC family protein [Chitinophagaceae bacterium]